MEKSFKDLASFSTYILETPAKRVVYLKI